MGLKYTVEDVNKMLDGFKNTPSKKKEVSVASVSTPKATTEIPVLKNNVVTLPTMEELAAQSKLYAPKEVPVLKKQNTANTNISDNMAAFKEIASGNPTPNVSGMFDAKMSTGMSAADPAKVVEGRKVAMDPEIKKMLAMTDEEFNKYSLDVAWNSTQYSGWDRVVNQNAKDAYADFQKTTNAQEYRIAQKMANLIGEKGGANEVVAYLDGEIDDLRTALAPYGYSELELTNINDYVKRDRNLNEVKQWASEHPVLGSVASLGTSLMNGAGIVEQSINYLEGKPVDTDQVGSMGDLTQALRSGVSSDMGGVGSFFYNALMGIGDLGTAVVAGGGNPFALAMGSASTSSQDAIDRGVDPTNALATGYATAAGEYITEMISLGNLKALRASGGKGMKSFLGSVAKQGLVEGTEEGASEIISKISDYAINGDLSESVMKYNQLISSGMSEADAKKEITKDITNDILYSAGVGAVSGGVMGGGANVVGQFSNTGNNTLANLPQNDTVSTQTKTTASDVVNTEEKTQKDAEAIENATPVQIKVGKATTITNPYQGIKPVQEKNEYERVTISEKVMDDVETNFQLAEIDSTFEGTKFSTTLQRVYEALFGSDGHPIVIPVENMTFEGKPYVVNVSKNSIGKIVSDGHLSKEKMSVINAIDEIIEKSQYVGSADFNATKNGKQKKGIRYDYFETAVEIAGEPYVVKFDVEVIPGVNNYRRHVILNEIDLTKATESDVETSVSEVPSSSVETVNNKTAAQEGLSSLSTVSIPNSSETVNNTETKVRGYNESIVEKTDLPEEVKVSKTRMNTMPKSGIATESEMNTYYPEMDFKYETVSEEKSMERARTRLESGGERYINELLYDDSIIEGSDIDALMMVYSEASQKARANNDESMYRYAAKIFKKIQTESTRSGQAIQALAKWSRNTPEGQVAEAMTEVQKEVSKRVGKKKLEKAQKAVDTIVEKAEKVQIAKNTPESISKSYDECVAELKKACEEATGPDYQKIFDDIIAQTTSVTGDSVIEILHKYGKLNKTVAEYLKANDAIQATALGYLYEIQENNYDINSREARELMAKAGKAIVSKMPTTVSSMVKQKLYNNMLGSFRTVISRNAFGNFGFAIMEQLRQPLAAAIDKAVSRKTGVRTTTGWSKEKQLAYVQGAIRGLKEEMSDIKLSLDEYAKGSYSGLHVSKTGENTLMNALNNNMATFNGNYQNKVVDKLFNGKNGILSKFENFKNDIIKHGMSAGDRMFYEATKDQAKVEINQLLKKNYNIDTDGLELDEYIEAASSIIALEAVYQNDTALSEGFSDIKKGLAQAITGVVGSDILTHASMPFVKTPSNVIDKTVQYSPLGVVRNTVSTVKEAKKGEFDQRRFVDETSRSIMGTLLFAGAALAFSNGLVSGGYDEDKDVRNAQKEAGMQEYAIKIGDKYMDAGWIPVLGPAIEGGAAFKTAYDQARKENKGVVPSLWSGTAAASSQTIQSVFDQSMLSSLSELLGSNSYGTDEQIASRVGEVILNGLSQSLPSWLRQLAQSTDEYQRYAGEYGTAEYKFNNIFANSIPVLRQQQNIKYGNDGQPMLQNDGRSTFSKFVENMVLPGKITQERNTPIYNEAMRLYEVTGLTTAFLPTAAMKDIRTESYEPTSAEFTEYKRLRGLYNTEAGEALMESEYYQNLSDEDKAGALSKIYTIMNQVAKKEVVPGYTVPKTYQKLYSLYSESGIDALVDFLAYKAKLASDEDTTTVNQISNLKSMYSDDTERGEALYYQKASISKYAQEALDDYGFSGLYDYYKFMAEADPKEANPTQEEVRAYLNTKPWMGLETKAYWYDLMCGYPKENPYR